MSFKDEVKLNYPSIKKQIKCLMWDCGCSWDDGFADKCPDWMFSCGQGDDLCVFCGQMRSEAVCQLAADSWEKKNLSD